MSYASRHSNGRFRHDPANTGIFIHGGTCCAGPHYRCCAAPNRFGITLPLRNRRGQEVGYSKEIESNVRKPTFMSALAHIRKLQAEHPVLADCPVYACTDLHMENSYSAVTLVQRVA